MSTVERDVKSLLRWYPRRWREQHGDAVLGMYLESSIDGGDPLRGPAGARERRAFRAAGMFERSRFILPVAAAAVGALAVIAGMILATLGEREAGAVLWIVAGPVFLSVSSWGLLAARAGSWSRLHVLGVLGSAVAALALMSTFWVAVQRDQIGVSVPGLDAFWALGVLYAAFVGLVTSTAMTGALRRSGMRWDWAVTVSFLSGFFGALPLLFAVLTGATLVVFAAVLLWAGIRSWRHRWSPAPHASTS